MRRGLPQLLLLASLLALGCGRFSAELRPTTLPVAVRRAPVKTSPVAAQTLVPSITPLWDYDTHG